MKGVSFADAVIKLARGVVEILCQPVDRRRALTIGLVIDGLDQGPPDTGSARLGAGKQVLQVAHRLDLPGVAVKQVMGQADKPPAGFGNKT